MALTAKQKTEIQEEIDSVYMMAKDPSVASQEVQKRARQAANSIMVIACREYNIGAALFVMQMQSFIRGTDEIKDKK